MTINDIKRLNSIHYSVHRYSIWGKPYTLNDCFWFFWGKRKKMMSNKVKESTALGDILFYAPELNNKRSLEPIMDNMPKESYTFWYTPGSLPNRGIWLRSLLYFPLFVVLYLKSNLEDRKLLGSFSWDYIRACGTYKTLEKVILNNPHLKMIVLASDQNIENRSLIELAEKYKIKTLYVQHASVTKDFPTLPITYSFLDGQESFDKYDHGEEMTGKFILSGGARFDFFYKYKNEEKKYDVGIALNALDNMEKVSNLCKYIKKHYSSRIIVRPHVSLLLNKRFKSDFFISQGIDISDSLKEPSCAFISKIKKMIAGESAIHLDAAIMDVPSIIYNMSDRDEILDIYSYVKNGLVKSYNSLEDLVFALTFDINILTETKKYYNASYDTPMEGKVGKMISSFIIKDIYDSHNSALDFISTYMIDKGKFWEYK